MLPSPRFDRQEANDGSDSHASTSSEASGSGGSGRPNAAGTSEARGGYEMFKAPTEWLNGEVDEVINPYFP